MNIHNLVGQKINEYIRLLEENGFITDKNLLNEIYNKLYSLERVILDRAPGNAKIEDGKIFICYKNIENGMRNMGNFYLDEVLFHEFSHVINSFYSVIRNNEFHILNYFQSKMDNSQNVSFENEYNNPNSLLYQQEPIFGFLCLNEFIAQYIAQTLVSYKLRNMSDISRKFQYSKDINLRGYRFREISTDLCLPYNLNINTYFACYPEICEVSEKVIKRYGFTVSDFVKKSLTKDFAKNFINRDKQTLEKLYIDLSYLGLVYKRLYLVCNLEDFTCGNDRDSAKKPDRVFVAIKSLMR